MGARGILWPADDGLPEAVEAAGDRWTWSELEALTGSTSHLVRTSVHSWIEGNQGDAQRTTLNSQATRACSENTGLPVTLWGPVVMVGTPDLPEE